MRGPQTAEGGKRLTRAVGRQPATKKVMTDGRKNSEIEEMRHVHGLAGTCEPGT